MIPNQKIRESRNTLWSLVFIAVLVVLVRLVVFMVYPQNGPNAGRSDPDGWLSIARNVVSGQGYAYFNTESPTARRGPTVVYFFAATLWLGGDHLWSIVFAQWIADTATAILLFFIAYEISQDRRFAFVAALLFALYGSGLVYTFSAWSEPVFTLVLAAFSLSLLRALRRPSLWRFALSGSLLGVAVLARPVMQFYPLVVLPLLCWSVVEKSWRQVFARFAVFCAAFACILLPWILRNYLVFHEFIPGSTHSGDAVYQGNFGLDRPDYLRYRTAEESKLALRHILETRFGRGPSSLDLFAYARAKGISEPELDRIAFQEALKVIVAFPARYAVASLVRLVRLWLGTRFVSLFSARGSGWGYIVGGLNGVLLALAVMGGICYGEAWFQSALPLIALIAYTTVIYTATIAVARFSVPIMPYVMIFAAQAICQVVSRIGTAPQLEQS
jgi:4-amino-4-deoxy-L-arabinose transferase-like glycosyltransferase